MQGLTQHPNLEISVFISQQKVLSLPAATAQQIASYNISYSLVLGSWTELQVFRRKRKPRAEVLLTSAPAPPFSKIQGTDTVKTSSPIYRLPQHLRFWKAETRKISVTLVCLNTKQIQNLFTFQRKILVTPKHPEPPNTFTIASVRNNHQIKNKPAHPKHTHIFFSIKHFPGRVLKFLNANC